MSKRNIFFCFFIKETKRTKYVRRLKRYFLNLFPDQCHSDHSYDNSSIFIWRKPVYNEQMSADFNPTTKISAQISFACMCISMYVTVSVYERVSPYMCESVS